MTSISAGFCGNFNDRMLNIAGIKQSWQKKPPAGTGGLCYLLYIF